MIAKGILVVATVALLGIGYVNFFGGTTDDAQSSTQPVSSQPVVDEAELPVFSAAEVAERNTREDCWTIIDGFVYDITEFIARHPGGVSNILRACGTDRTAQFQSTSGPHNQSSLQSVAQYRIGRLQ